MDADRIKDLVGSRHRSAFDPADPIFLVGKIVEDAAGDVQTKTLAEVGKLLAGFADQIATASVLAETAAKTRAETTVTAAAQWAADHLKAAGIDAGQRAARPLEEALEQAAQAARRATIAAWVSGMAAVTATGIATVMFFH
jgi:hypothetical protein